MGNLTKEKAAPTSAQPGEPSSVAESARRCGQIVLVLQGGGALGAYHAGVYEGLCEAGIELDWVIGTSIGAINGAIITGNRPADRLPRLRQFWKTVASRQSYPWAGEADPVLSYFDVLYRGVPGFFEPNPLSALFGMYHRLGTSIPSFYEVQPLRRTLGELIDPEILKAKHPRFTVGAVNVRSGEMRYFDTNQIDLRIDHVLASGALPPAFPAVEIDGECYWDGGVYSNTPMEAVLDDRPRRHSLIFAVNLWQPQGDPPNTIWEVLGRQKDIQYSSRLKSHIKRQDQIHRLRHIIHELSALLPEEAKADPEIRDMMAYGCTTTMHLVGLLAPRLDGEDHTKDVDFSSQGIEMRWRRGYEDITQVLGSRPWENDGDSLQGIVVHENCAHEFTVGHGS